VSDPGRAARRTLTVGLALYGAFLATQSAHYGWLDALDLAIHEAGHPVFGLLGEWLGFAGGTLMQLLVPAAFFGYFWRRHDRHAATVMGWWIAQNLWNVARYIADARAEALPLVGGGEHDWAYLLGTLGALHRDLAIAHGVHFAGVLVFLWSCLAGWQYAGAAHPTAGAGGPARGA
jgi:hypothetical protein